MSFDEERKYIHDLANSLSIIDASIARALGLLMKSHPELTEEIHRLKKADEYSKKSVQTLREFRDFIHAQVKKEDI